MTSNSPPANSAAATAAAAGAASLAALSLSLLRSGAHSDTLPSLTFNTLGKPFYPINGYVKPGYEPVLEAYRKNFELGDEIGSTLCIYVRGEKVVDFYGGWTDSTRKTPYTAETVNVTFSSGKAVMTFMVLYCVSQGLFKLDDKVADIWPEFAEGGKENVKVEDILAHRGGVAWLEKAFNKVTTEDMLTENLDKLEAKIAGNPHNYPKGNRQAYHAVTRGWYLNACIRRRHAEHLSAGQIWKQVLNPMIGTDVFVGLPATEDYRCADLEAYPAWKNTARMYVPEWVTGMKMVPKAPTHQSFLQSGSRDDRDSLPSSLKIMLTGPRVPPPNHTVAFPARTNLPEYRRGEGPSFNTCTNARSLAKLASIMSLGGVAQVHDPSSPTRTTKIQLISPEVLSAALEPAEDLGPDDNLDLTMPPLTRCGFGFAKGYKVPNAFRLSDGSFRPKDSEMEWYGWDGMGGSICVFEKTKGIGVGYTMNGLHPGGGWSDVRLGRVLGAFAECFEKLEKKGESARL